MRALVGAVAVLVGAGSCQLIRAVSGGGSPGQIFNAGVSDASHAGNAAADIERECEASAARPVSWEEELAIGGAVALAMSAKTKGVFIDPSPELPAGKPDPAQWKDKKPAAPPGVKTDLHAYLNRLGKSLAINSARPYIDWKFVVIDDPAVNAFSAPGGYVMVTTGLLRKAENEAQLAGVLGHEVGHVVHRHAITAYKKSKKETCVWAKGFAKLTGAAAQAAGGQRAIDQANHYLGLLNAPRFDPNQLSADIIAKLVEPLVDNINNVGLGGEAEKEADRTATELMVFSGYDPAEFSKLIGKLPDSGGYRAHPKNAERQAVVDATMKDNAAFLNALKAPPTDGAVVTALK